MSAQRRRWTTRLLLLAGVCTLGILWVANGGEEHASAVRHFLSNLARHLF